VSHREILLVEDNPGDVRLTKEALKECGVPHQLTVAGDGVEAMRLLRGGQTPDLIQLDLNQPRKDGREVLEEVKADPQLRRIPVVILTTSNSQTDVARAYDLHVNAYVVKPVDMDRFVEVIKAVDAFWFDVARLPKG
jgi:CheY-like chemotaxis protein